MWGLWTIDRRGAARANAYAEAGDSVFDLASKIGLDTADSLKWLRDSTGHPVSPVYSPHACERFTIPNKILVVTGGGVNALSWSILVSRATELYDHAVADGYDAIYLNYDISPFDKSDITGQKADLHGFMLFGHGAVPSGRFVISLGESDAEDLFSDDMTQYGYGIIVVKFCSSGVGAWDQLVSPGGYIHQTYHPYTWPFIASWNINSIKQALDSQR